MSESKKLLGYKPIKYLVITNPDGGHTGQSARPITLKEARQLLKNETICVYIFKVPTTMYHKLMFKYPLSKYYSCLEINNYRDNVWTSLNVINKEEKDFTEYIEITTEYNDIYKEYECKMYYKTI